MKSNCIKQLKELVYGPHVSFLKNIKVAKLFDRKFITCWNWSLQRAYQCGYRSFHIFLNLNHERWSRYYTPFLVSSCRFCQFSNTWMGWKRHFRRKLNSMDAFWFPEATGKLVKKFLVFWEIYQFFSQKWANGVLQHSSYNKKIKYFWTWSLPVASGSQNSSDGFAYSLLNCW